VALTRAVTDVLMLIGKECNSMDYRNFNGTIYIRMDRGDEIIGNIIEICRKEQIKSAVFSGIGGCKQAEIQTFIPEKGSFETQTLDGMLELVSLNGNIVTDENGEYFHHTHAMFSFKKDGGHHMAGGHIKSITVLYTAEIELRPTAGGVIKRKFDPETGTGFWNFDA
jgi:predicted DNA-binding protein with PD1-like motif